MTAPGAVAADVLMALADPTRRQLLDLLAAHGDSTATALAAELPVTRQAVVKHLTALARAGLVTRHRTGRELRYQVRPDPLHTTAHWMTQTATHWSTPHPF